MVIKYNNFIINEKLGILEDLDDFSNYIINLINKSNNDYIKIYVNYLNKNITLHIFIGKRYLSTKEDACFIINNVEDLEFTIKIIKLNKSLIIHELKHMDRFLRQNMILNRYFYKLQKSFKKVIYKNKNLFYNKSSPDLLMNVLYYANPDEFESNYNEIFYILKNKIEKNTNIKDKRKIIYEHLKEREIYYIYEYFYKYGFDLLSFFKNKKSYNIFIKEFKNILNNNNNKIYFNKIINWVNSLFNFSNEEDEIIIDKNIKKINYIINKNIKKNYLKINKLYSLLI